MRILIAHFATHWVNTSGGMEKATCAFANAMSERGHDVAVWYIGKEEGESYFPLKPGIQTRNILFEDGRQIVSEKLPIRLRAYREFSRLFSQRKAQEINATYKGRMYGKQIQRYLSKYDFDIVVSCSEQSAKYLIMDGQCKIPVIEMIHVDPEMEFPKLSEPEIAAVSQCKAIQILTESGKQIARHYFPQVPIEVIGNAVEPAKIIAHPDQERSQHLISCVGVLSHNKNQKFLVDVWAGLKREYPDWKIEIWGNYDIPYGQKVKEYILDKGLGGEIFLKGRTNAIEQIYGRSDIFVIPSHSEGWGLALTEAMAAGLPAIGLKSCGGVSALIQDGITGFLVDENIESFGNKLRILMDDSALRRKMGSAGRNAMRVYSPDRIWDQWERLLEETRGVHK